MNLCSRPYGALWGRPSLMAQSACTFTLRTYVLHFPYPLRSCGMRMVYPSSFGCKSTAIKAVKELMKLVDDGLEPNYMTWTCVLQACCYCKKRSNLLMLLAALSDTGCTLPLRLFIKKEAAMSDVESWLTNLRGSTLDGGEALVNALVDVLWAFKQRATAGHLYNLAKRLGLYAENFTRVQEHNWEADFRKLSPGTALVALTTWLIQMQEASLQGFPESSKEVVVITGTRGEGNRVTLMKTITAHLWEKGSPFYMKRGRAGALVAKGYSVRLWLKDSPLCLNMDLENVRELPNHNVMDVYNGAWMSADAVPVMEQIQASLGEVWPRKYAKLAQMSDSERGDILTNSLENKRRTTKWKPSKTPK